MLSQRFLARVTKINNFIPLFPRSDATKKMLPEKLNDILLYAIPNGWAKRAYLQGLDSRMKTFRETCVMFDRMEFYVQVYKGQTPSKKIPRADANRDSHVRKRKIGEDASPTNSKKVHAVKHKTKMHSL